MKTADFEMVIKEWYTHSVLIIGLLHYKSSLLFQRYRQASSGLVRTLADTSSGLVRTLAYSQIKPVVVFIL